MDRATRQKGSGRNFGLFAWVGKSRPTDPLSPRGGSGDSFLSTFIRCQVRQKGVCSIKASSDFDPTHRAAHGRRVFLLACKLRPTDSHRLDPAGRGAPASSTPPIKHISTLDKKKHAGISMPFVKKILKDQNKKWLLIVKFLRI